MSEVAYEVGAKQVGGELTITHTLRGQSFIRELIENGEAIFSVLLFYKDSSERQRHQCNDVDKSDDGEGIVATQIIAIEFTYAPTIMPSIIILKESQITVSASSGLTDFWREGEYFNIPAYSRIALGPRLSFTSGEVQRLMSIECDNENILNPGEMKVIVNESAGEGEKPVTLLCAKDIFDELHKIKNIIPSNAKESMRLAIITQALSAVYAYMNYKDHDDVGGVLKAHLDDLLNKTGENWENKEDFNPSLAATKMQPYAIRALNNEVGDDQL